LVPYVECFLRLRASHEAQRNPPRRNVLNDQTGRKTESALLNANALSALFPSRQVKSGHYRVEAGCIQQPSASSDLNLDRIRRQLGNLHLRGHIAKLHGSGRVWCTLTAGSTFTSPR